MIRNLITAISVAILLSACTQDTANTVATNVPGNFYQGKPSPEGHVQSAPPPVISSKPSPVTKVTPPAKPSSVAPASKMTPPATTSSSVPVPSSKKISPAATAS
ncbi:MAG TPA: hypothetical protein VL360_08110 [Gammaproteobacteria bacterium]|nr:hypothetical protein [Gammaproteobacteria bacterium]